MRRHLIWALVPTLAVVSPSLAAPTAPSCPDAVVQSVIPITGCLDRNAGPVVIPVSLDPEDEILVDVDIVICAEECCPGFPICDLGAPCDSHTGAGLEVRIEDSAGSILDTDINSVRETTVNFYAEERGSSGPCGHPTQVVIEISGIGNSEKAKYDGTITILDRPGHNLTGTTPATAAHVGVGSAWCGSITQPAAAPLCPLAHYWAVDLQPGDQLCADAWLVGNGPGSTNVTLRVVDAADVPQGLFLFNALAGIAGVAADGDYTHAGAAGTYYLKLDPGNNRSLWSYSIAFELNGLATDSPVHAASAGSLELDVRPNPGRGPRDIAFSLPVAGPVTLRVLDVAGRVVASPVDQWMSPGRHQVTWTGRTAQATAAPGVYFVQLSTRQGTVREKLTVVR